MVRKQNTLVEQADRDAAVERWREGAAIAELAAAMGVHRNTIHNWIRGQLRKGMRPREVDPDPRRRKIEELQLQISALEATVGRQAVEIRFFRGALRRVEVSRQQKEKTGGTASTPKSEA